MAQYRFSAQVIKRSDGRSAVAAAAYRAGERLVDERLEMPFDYSHRAGVEHTEIMLPYDADRGLANRSVLWNQVEAAEKRSDAQVAREVQLSLPHELSFDQRRELVRDFVQTAFVDRGMVADIAMHTPDKHGDDRNFHAHVMLTTREVDGINFTGKDREWNSRQTLAEWRQAWAETQNRHLAQALGPNAPQVSHKSLEDRGINREATIHLGPTASAIERKGERSDRGDVNRAVAADNAERKAIRKQEQADLDMHAVIAPQRDARVELLDKELVGLDTALRRQVTSWKAEKAAIRTPQILKPADLRKEIVGPARAQLGDAERALERTRERTKIIAVKRQSLASFIRDPQRAIWAKIREVHALDRARREVARARAGVKVREDWLRSDKGQAYVLNRIDQSARTAMPAKQQTRTLDRKIRRIEKRIKTVETLRERVQIAQQLGVKTMSLPLKPLSQEQIIRHIDRCALTAFSRVSPQQLQHARQTVRSLAKGMTMGFSR